MAPSAGRIADRSPDDARYSYSSERNWLLLLAMVHAWATSATGAAPRRRSGTWRSITSPRAALAVIRTGLRRRRRGESRSDLRPVQQGEEQRRVPGRTPRRRYAKGRGGSGTEGPTEPRAVLQGRRRREGTARGHGGRPRESRCRRGDHSVRDGDHAGLPGEFPGDPRRAVHPRLHGSAPDNEHPRTGSRDTRGTIDRRARRPGSTGGGYPRGRHGHLDGRRDRQRAPGHRTRHRRTDTGGSATGWMGGTRMPPATSARARTRSGSPCPTCGTKTAA